MKILVYGRGVISSQYAWVFEQAGHEVTFYVRPGRKAEWGETLRLEIHDLRKGLKGNLVSRDWPVTLVEEIPERNDYDLFLVSVNTHQFPAVVEHIASRAGKATVLFFNNIWDEPYRVVAPIPVDQVVWGFPFAGGGFDTGDTLRGGFLGMVALGRDPGVASPREDLVRSLFSQAGIKTSLQKDMKRWLWNHYIVNAAMEGALAKAGSFTKLFESREALREIVLNLRELLPLLRARGTKPDASCRVLGGLPAGLVAWLFKNVVFKPGSAAYRMIAPAHPPIGFIAKDVVATAEKLGVAVPRMTELARML